MLFCVSGSVGSTEFNIYEPHEDSEVSHLSGELLDTFNDDEIFLNQYRRIEHHCEVFENLDDIS